METTDWDVFRRSYDNVNDLTVVISRYLGFERDTCVPFK